MITERQIDQVVGSAAVGSDGEKLGKVSDVYLDDATGRPEWATVHTGLFGTKKSFVPLAQAEFGGKELRVPYDKHQVSEAPRAEEDDHLSQDEEAMLYRYYGLRYSEATSESGLPTGPVGREQAGHDSPGDRTTEDAMTRSEERLRVGTQSVETGKVRLRKYVVTRKATQTVPLTHEEVRVEREPITDANRDKAMDGPQFSEEEHEVTLHAQRPVVDKEVVPVERVRLDTETVTGETQVTEPVRKEEIVLEETDDAGDDDRKGRR